MAARVTSNSTAADERAATGAAVVALCGRAAALLGLGLGLAIVPSLPLLQVSSASFERFQRWSLFAGGLLVGSVLTTVRAKMRERPATPREGHEPSPAMPATIAAVWVGLVSTVVTAVALFIESLLERPHDPVLVLAHELGAAALVLAMLAKMLLIGSRAAARRARRIWGSLVANLALLVGVYAAVTGVLVAVYPTWSNQHLAAAFWSLVLVGSHISQAQRFAKRKAMTQSAAAGAAPRPNKPT
ncbi:MAG: hypothetical protein LC777_11950 [Actinobacteria bacterium]|nr:hypothetical protein [Actinomycetota bacterium]